jgi:hypothetical protein
LLPVSKSGRPMRVNQESPEKTPKKERQGLWDKIACGKV